MRLLLTLFVDLTKIFELFLVFKKDSFGLQRIQGLHVQNRSWADRVLQLDEQDFIAGCSKMHIIESETEAKTAFHRTDVDDTGSMQFSEFSEWYIAYCIEAKERRSAATTGQVSRGTISSLGTPMLDGERNQSQGDASEHVITLSPLTEKAFLKKTMNALPVLLTEANDASEREKTRRHEAVAYGDLVCLRMPTETGPPVFLTSSYDVLGSQDVLALPVDAISQAFFVSGVFEVVDPEVAGRKGHPVRYGERIKLMHCGSRDFLSLDIGERSEISSDFGRVHLDPNSTEDANTHHGGARGQAAKCPMCAFVSTKKTRELGSAVSGEDVVQLEFRPNTAPPQAAIVAIRLKAQDDALDQPTMKLAATERTQDGDGPIQHEKHEQLVASSLKICIFEKYTPDVGRASLRIGDVVELHHVESESSIGSVGTDDQLCIYQPPRNCSDEESFEFKRHLFVITNPRLDTGWRGGVLQPGDYFRMMDLSSSRYVSLSDFSEWGDDGDNTRLTPSLHGVESPDSEEALVCISPYHTRTVVACGQPHQLHEYCSLLITTDNAKETSRICSAVTHQLHKKGWENGFEEHLLKAWDTNHDGRLSLTEFEDGLTAEGVRLQPDEWKLLLSHVHGGYEMSASGKSVAVVDVPGLNKFGMASLADAGTSSTPRVVQLRASSKEIRPQIDTTTGVHIGLPVEPEEKQNVDTNTGTASG